MPVLGTWSDYQAVLHDEEWRFTVRSNIVEYGLTPRESEVVLALLCGMSNKDMGRALGISTETVNNHMRTIKIKVGVQDRLQLALRLLGVI